MRYALLPYRATEAEPWGECLVARADGVLDTMRLWLLPGGWYDHLLAGRVRVLKTWRRLP